MTTTQPTVSVIVPAFNVEQYLDQALLSAEGQSLRNIEIICVNDGSTDATLSIIDRHAKRDERIRVIDKPNGGYGSACNCGIDAARGEWVAILEPDDWIERAMYADMTAFAASLNEPVDIVKTPYWRIVDPDTPDERRLNCSYKGRIQPKRQPFTMADRHVDHLLIHHPSIWSALYRRTFLDEFGIRFHEIPGAGWADNPFLVDTLCQARSIAYLDRAYYCYREETQAKTSAFAAQHIDVPFERWHDMMDSLERIGETSPSVLRAQFRRGFTYLDYIGEGASLDNDRVRAIMERMFARMDDGIVLSEPHISPVWKMRYQDVKGLSKRRVSPIPYAASLAESALYSLKNIGPAETARLVGSVARRDKAAGNAGDSAKVDDDGERNASCTADWPGTLSIVIPVYNCERYLDDCLDSVELQTAGNLEVVCVNDGSTDGTAEILERHALRDERIRVVNKPNGGPSSARNAGIEAAHGDYLAFLDCDDLLEKNACRRLAEVIARDKPDVIAFGWSCFPKGRANRWLMERTNVRDATYPTFEPALLFREHTNPYLRVAIRRQLLVENGIAFDEGLRIGEDCAFLFSLFPRAGKTRLISDRLYRYRMPHEGSIMAESTEGTPAKCLDDLLMAISIFSNWHRSGLLAPYGHQLMHWFVTMQLYTILRLPTPARNDIVALVKQLFTAHFTDGELERLDIFARDRSLIDIVLASNEDGTLNVSERALRRIMLSWRIAEYGLRDLALTALDRAR